MARADRKAAAAESAKTGVMTHRQIMFVLFGLMSGMFLSALDQSVVGTAMRTIADDLNGLSAQAWVTTAYLITSTIATPIYGKLGDIFGRRYLFITAITIFIVGSVISGFATSMYELAAFRAIQGIGAGGLFGSVTLLYNVAPAATSRGDFEDQSNSNSPGVNPGGFPNNQSQTAIAIPEINVQLKSEAIVAKTRKLKAQWTPEFAQDLNAYHSVDAEAELTGILSQYISMEIDLELLDMLIQNAFTVDAWSAVNNTTITATGTGANAVNANAADGGIASLMGFRKRK